MDVVVIAIVWSIGILLVMSGLLIEIFIARTDKAKESGRLTTLLGIGIIIAAAVTGLLLIDPTMSL